jgi:hypothetical protein
MSISEKFEKATSLKEEIKELEYLVNCFAFSNPHRCRTQIHMLFSKTTTTLGIKRTTYDENEFLLDTELSRKLHEVLVEHLDGRYQLFKKLMDAPVEDIESE